jgi:Zn-dependent protease with chaperone function
VLTATALVVSALVPFVCAFWSSRGLLARLDDPLLPDRLLAHSRRVGTAAGVAIGAGAIFAPAYFPWVVLLSWISALAGGFRARKSVFDEAWGFLSYLDHTLRFWIGLLGSFAVVAVIPWAMSIAGSKALSVGLVLGLVAWVWMFFGPFVFRVLVRARPFVGSEADALSIHFSRILERASCRAPALFIAEARGGSWINAFALPEVSRPGVLFTRGFLDALSPREIAAIFAHEVAHLEHWTPRKVALGRALGLLMVALPIFLWAGPASPFLRGWEWMWPIAFFVAMTLKAARNRGHEAESDRRAIELCSDPDALVSALTKLHALNRISRRWDAAYESLSTHPSLAHRVRAIHAASGNRGEIVAEALFRASDGSDRAVFFDSSRVHFLEGLPRDGEALLARSAKRRSYRYEDVHELRVQANHELVLKSGGGETARMAVRVEDVRAVEEVLDRVDGLLGETPRAAEAPAARLWSLVVGLLGLIPSPSWVVVALAGAAFARPSFFTFLALGASGLASAAWLPEPWWRSVSLALAAVAALLAAVRKRSLPRGRREALPALVVPLSLVLLSIVSAVSGLFSTLPAMHASLWARESPSAFAGLVALGAVLLSLPRVASRLAGVVALAAAFALVVLGSSAFRERFGGDLFASSGDPIPVKEAFLTPIREVRIPGHVARIALSPRGERFAAALVSLENEEDLAYLVESTPGRLEPMRALALEYLDEDRILFVDRSNGRAFLKVASVSELESAFVLHPLPLLAGIRLESDGSTWWVSGYDPVQGSQVLVRGGFDSAPAEELRFWSEDGRTPLAVSGDAALLAGYDVGALLPFVPMLSMPRFAMELEIQTNRGPSSVGASLMMPYCFASSLAEPGFYCSVVNGQETGLFFLASGSSSFETLGFIAGGFHANESAPDGFLLLNRFDGPAHLFERSRKVAWRLDTRAQSLVLRNRVLAVARTVDRDDETVVSLYTVGE